ncbi:hypothetical protein AWM75_00195 [Aerococcus urinaehominis]|uniref:Uncharacterized protein n=1 Tax=Aerococcus urinaehominis TaxID=128944 RepID=A0A0X8FJN4_9LACT|nr:hypothetical protein [Aerococcus urinaehominis]AMB98505.1 hypothetical protein AWM75_00195 [Aerococcus urinaehominis]SDL80359.1 hypothetical protein SAMN04487985_101108 [Aerococcus urinaehominis]
MIINFKKFGLIVTSLACLAACNQTDNESANNDDATPNSSQSQASKALPANQDKQTESAANQQQDFSGQVIDQSDFASYQAGLTDGQPVDPDKVLELIQAALDKNLQLDNGQFSHTIILTDSNQASKQATQEVTFEATGSVDQYNALVTKYDDSSQTKANSHMARIGGHYYEVKASQNQAGDKQWQQAKEVIEIPFNLLDNDFTRGDLTRAKVSQVTHYLDGQDHVYHLDMSQAAKEQLLAESQQFVKDNYRAIIAEAGNQYGQEHLTTFGDVTDLLADISVADYGMTVRINQAGYLDLIVKESQLDYQGQVYQRLLDGSQLLAANSNQVKQQLDQVKADIK